MLIFLVPFSDPPFIAEAINSSFSLDGEISAIIEEQNILDVI